MELNEFYSIAEKENIKQDTLQIANLGEQCWRGSVGIPQRNGWGERTHQVKRFYSPTTKEDYDNEFVYRIITYNPPYEIEEFLNFHFEYYTKKTNNPQRFIKHLKYVILPLVEKNKNSKVYLELLNIWLNNSTISLVNNQTEIQGDKNIALQNITNSNIYINKDNH